VLNRFWRALAPAGRRVLPAAAGVVWLLVVAGGFSRLTTYANTPAPQGNAGAEWPAASSLARKAGRPTIVMFGHPQCPCSRASVGELANVAARAQDRATVHVVFFRPSSAPDGWERTSLWQSAETIPSVRVSADPDGAEAARFGALASGQTYFYDAAGTLRFSGGITPARGHSGDSSGRQALEALLAGRIPPGAVARVFGCVLRQPTTN
jgi:hypothetical protein